VLYLGEINDSQREAWIRSIEVFDEDQAAMSGEATSGNHIVLGVSNHPRGACGIGQNSTSNRSTDSGKASTINFRSESCYKAGLPASLYPRQAQKFLPPGEPVEYAG
jgi:hypothetical protein